MRWRMDLSILFVGIVSIIFAAVTVIVCEFFRYIFRCETCSFSYV